MAYVTYTEYLTYNPITELQDGTEFAFLSERASDIIDRLTINKIPLLGGISVFSTFTQERIRKATSAQIDTLYGQGSIDALTGNSDNVKDEVKIGSYTEKSLNNTLIQNGLKMIDGMPISPLIDSYLQPTNLLNTALNRCYSVGDFL